MLIREIFSFVSNEFSKENIPCLLVGGMALSAYRPARNTTDIDFLIDELHADKAVRTLNKLGYTPFQKNENFIRLESKNSDSLFVDLLLVEKNTLTKMMADGKKYSVNGTEFIIPSMMHMLAMKLHAMKNNKSRELKDLVDVFEIVKQNKLDITSKEFKDLCLKFGTADLYQKIINVFK